MTEKSSFCHAAILGKEPYILSRSYTWQGTTDKRGWCYASVSYHFRSFFPWILCRDTCSCFLCTMADIFLCSYMANCYKVSKKRMHSLWSFTYSFILAEARLIVQTTIFQSYLYCFLALCENPPKSHLPTSWAISAVSKILHKPEYGRVLSSLVVKKTRFRWVCKLSTSTPFMP